VANGRCQKRSEETFSKQSYHHGTVIIRCEGCQNLHLIADHLKIVSETKVELEDILQGKTVVRRGVYLEDRGSVVEFGESETEAEIDELAAVEISKQEDK
jgi:mitochondrial protein import protein ZIM17